MWGTKKKHLYWICNKWVSVYHVIYSVQDNILVKMDDTQAYMWKTESIKTVKTSIIEVSGCFGAGVDTCMTNLSVHQHDGSLGKKKKKCSFLCLLVLACSASYQMGEVVCRVWWVRCDVSCLFPESRHPKALNGGQAGTKTPRSFSVPAPCFHRFCNTFSE